MPWTYWLFLSALALGALFGLVAILGGEHDHAGDADAEDAHLFEGVLSFLGFGHVPLGALLTIDLLLFGGAGIMATEVLSALLPESVAALVALAAAAILAPLLGGRLVRALGRRLPVVESHGVSRAALVGRLGKAALRVDAAFGRAHVVDDGGALHHVSCLTHGQPIERGEELVLVDLDDATGSYLVERADFSAH